jgi:cytidylate kinase
MSPDATLVDTTHLDLPDVVEHVLKLVAELENV